MYDSLIDTRLLDFAPSHAEKICVGKRSHRASTPQSSINELLVSKALEGKTVVRLKGGDPFVFGRGGEELMYLRERGIECAVVPGISSCIAVPELAGIPATHRGVSRSFHVITGHTREDLLPENMEKYAALDGTLVFLMGLGHIEEITSALIANGKDKDTPAAVIFDGASNKSRVVRGTLQTIARLAKQDGIFSPAVTVVGQTAAFNLHSALFKEFSVTITGTPAFAERLSQRLSVLGARVEYAARLHVAEYEHNPALDNALRSLLSYGTVVLTSVNGVRIFFKRLAANNIDIRLLHGVRFAAIGSGTARALSDNGVFAEIVPYEYTSEALGKEIAAHGHHGGRVLILRANQGSEELTRVLSEEGIPFDDIKTYDVKCTSTEIGREITTDFLTFASRSGVRAFFERGYTVSASTKIVCIGDGTAQALEQYGVSDYITSGQHDARGMAETILQLAVSS